MEDVEVLDAPVEALPGQGDSSISAMLSQEPCLGGVVDVESLCERPSVDIWWSVWWASQAPKGALVPTVCNNA